MATTPGPAPGARSHRHIQDMDDLLRCGICFDYFNIAMIIPQCSHNYCSLCIRKSLSYKTQCPTCCMTVTESDLRNNRILDNLVQAFISARQHLSQCTLDSPPMSPNNKLATSKVTVPSSRGCAGKQIKQENKLMDAFVVKAHSIPSKRALKAPKKQAEDAHQDGPSNCTAKIKEEPDFREESMLTEPLCSATPSTSAVKVSVKVDCPVCGVGIPEQFINKHLDSCLTRDEKRDSLRSSVHRRKSMAKVVYNLLSDRDVKKRLKEVGLSTQGSRQQMIRRHQEFVHMYNAQCDALNPKSAAEIVCEIENNEKMCAQLEAKHEERGMRFLKNQTEHEIDGIHQQYRMRHKSEFQQLINQVKNRKRKSGVKKIKEEPNDNPIDAEDVHLKKDESLSEIPAPKETPLEGQVMGFHMETLSQPVLRSSSPVFPMSPQSTLSSSSDILREMDEADVCEESNAALSLQPRVRKRKQPTAPRTPDNPVTLRSKRQRK